jgi:hypothetical protein
VADHSFLLLRHDVLDAQLADAKRQCIGRVDDLLLDLSGDVPRVSCIVIGGAARAQRIGIVALAARKLVNLLFRRDQDVVSRVSFNRVTCIGDRIELDVEGDDLPSSQREVWLRDHFISRIPGASGDRK